MYLDFAGDPCTDLFPEKGVYRLSEKQVDLLEKDILNLSW